MKMYFAHAAMFALSIALSACKPELEVRLASAGERLPAPKFVVEELARRGQRPRYDTVQVLDQDGKIVWHLRAEPFGDSNSTATLTYGAPPAGFVEVVSAGVLAAEKRYAIVVTGTARGELKFRAGADGVVALSE